MPRSSGLGFGQRRTADEIRIEGHWEDVTELGNAGSDEKGIEQIGVLVLHRRPVTVCRRIGRCAQQGEGAYISLSRYGR